MSLIERSFREKIVLVGVTLPPATAEDTEAGLDELSALVDTAGADEVAAPRAAPRRARPAHLHRQGQGRGAARAGAGDRLRHRGVRQRAHAGAAAQPREAARPHRHRPHRGDPRHLRPERPQPGGQGAGRAGAAPLPPAPHPRQGHRAVASRPVAPPRPAALGSAPAVRARRSSRSTGGASSAASTSSRRELREIDKHRATQRKAQHRARTQRVAIVGYTNAGKSTLLNRLTDAGVLVEDRLFATLDATTRRLDLPGGETVLLTDTVGFIRKLPHQLVEAFKSTLSVAADADLLVHVVDASALDPEGNIDAVRTVLARDRRRRGARALRVQQGRPGARARPPASPRSHEGAVAFSAATGEGVEELLLTDRRPAPRPHHRGRAGRPLRPRRRPRRRAPRGRGARASRPATTAMRLRVRLDDASLGQFTDYVVA